MCKTAMSTHIHTCRSICKPPNPHLSAPVGPCRDPPLLRRVIGKEASGADGDALVELVGRGEVRCDLVLRVGRRRVNSHYYGKGGGSVSPRNMPGPLSLPTLPRSRVRGRLRPLQPPASAGRRVAGGASCLHSLSPRRTRKASRSYGGSGGGVGGGVRSQ